MSSMPLTDAASDARRDDVVAAASNKQTDKQKKVLEWVSKISLDDIVFSETEWIKLGRDEEQKTRLQSVKGLPSSQLTVFALTRLCVQFRISGYKDKAKHVLCELIVNAVKANNLDAIMYPNDFGGATVTAMNDGTENETASTKKKKKDKKSKPAAIQQEGTFYRVIVTYFLQDVRPYVIKLGSQPNKSALDKRELLHQPIFDKLAEVYNDESRNDLKSLPYTHEMYAKCNVHANIPSKFDPLTARDISESLDFINYHYRISMQNCRKSGSHDDFHNFVRNKPYLLTYHQCLGDAPIELKGLASSELDESVKRVTTTRPNKSKGATSKKKNKKQRRTGSKQDKLTSAAKKMANASEERTVLAEKTNAAFMALQRGKYAVENVAGMSQLLASQEESLLRAQKVLREMKKGSDCDSSDEERATSTIEFWKKRRNETMANLELLSGSLDTALFQPGKTSTRGKPVFDIDASDNSPASEASSSDYSSHSSMARKESSGKKNRGQKQKTMTVSFLSSSESSSGEE